MIDWKQVDPNNFEHFTHYILSKGGFHNRVWFGKGGGDRGRDIVAFTNEELPFQLSYQRKWIFQCKKHSKFPPKNKIINEIATAMQHHPDFWVLVIPLNPTSDQLDYINSIQNNYNFKLLILPLAIIEESIHKYPESMNILLNGYLKKEVGEEFTSV